jgi:hypothetical protein
MAAINRFYYSTKYTSRSQVVSLGIKCVFISHQKADKDAAKKVADYLKEAGIDVYFDEYDTELRIHHQANNPKAVTDAIKKGINNSSHMLAIISPNTLTSSWVPFEIGYGFDKTELGVLCLKGIPIGKLPEYVRTALIIRDIYDLNNLISRLSGSSEEILVEARKIKNYSDYYNPLNAVMDSMINDKY